MSSVESYKKALTNLVDGQRRLTTELRRMKTVNEEQEAELLMLRKSSSVLKTRVSQFSQFLRSTASLAPVYKTVEYARLGSDGDIAINETPKITAELAEFFRTVTQLEGSTSSRASRNAGASQSLIRALSPLSDDGHPRVRSTSVASSSTLPNDPADDALRASISVAPQELPLPKEVLDKSVNVSSEVVSVGSGKDSPLPITVLMGHAVDVPSTTLGMPRLQGSDVSTRTVVFAHAETQCELLLSSATPIIGTAPPSGPSTARQPERPSHFVDRWLPPYLSSLSPSLKRDAEDILFRIHTTADTSDTSTGQIADVSNAGVTAVAEGTQSTTLGAPSEENPNANMAKCVAQLMLTQQQLAMARSSVASMRARLEDVMHKYQKASAALVALSKPSAASTSANMASSFLDGWGSDAALGATSATPEMFPMLPAIPMPSTPRPPTQSRSGGMLPSRGGQRGKHVHKLDATISSHLPSIGTFSGDSVLNASPSLVDAASSLLTYFVEDVCGLLRDARLALTDLDKLHWRLASHEQHYGSDATIKRNKQQQHHAMRPAGQGSTRDEVKRTHPFHTCTSPVLARIAEVLTMSLKEGREAPRFSASSASTGALGHLAAAARVSNSRAGHRRHPHEPLISPNLTAEGHPQLTEIALLVQSCWHMLVEFLDAQVHHAQTMVFVREPNLDAWMQQSPTLAALVAQATTPDNHKLSLAV